MDFQVLRWKDRHPFWIKALLPIIHYGGSHWVFLLQNNNGKADEKGNPPAPKKNLHLTCVSLYLKIEIF